MKTTENKVSKDITPKISVNDADMAVKVVKPLQSLRPMKSMVRVKSFRPQKIEINKSRRKAIKL